jgi:hypothetical protein
VFVANEIYAALEELSQALSRAGFENRVVADSETEAHVFLPRCAAAVSSSSVVEASLPQEASSTSPSLDRDIALMWGSTVHYAWGGEAGAEVQPQLSPSAKFQAALLKALRDVEVVIVPHWWWLRGAHNEDRGRRLMRFILHPEERAAARFVAANPALTTSERLRHSSHVE